MGRGCHVPARPARPAQARPQGSLNRPETPARPAQARSSSLYRSRGGAQPFHRGRYGKNEPNDYGHLDVLSRSVVYGSAVQRRELELARGGVGWGGVSHPGARQGKAIRPVTIACFPIRIDYIQGLRSPYFFRVLTDTYFLRIVFGVNEPEPPALLAGYDPNWEPRRPQPLHRHRLTDYPNQGGEVEGEAVVRLRRVKHPQIKRGRWYADAKPVRLVRVPGRWAGHTTWHVEYKDGTTGVLTNIELLSRRKV